MLERDYQAKLIKKIKTLFPGCFILKNDPHYCQGILDLLVLYNKHWAMLEVKRSKDEEYEPNQEYYIELLNQMSFAARIDPSNEQEVLNALQRAFEPRRDSRLSGRQ